MCLCISVLHYLCRMCDGKTSKIVAFIAHKKFISAIIKQVVYFVNYHVNEINLII